MNAPQVHVTYCDDIRSEIGGKLSLIGVYAGEMIVGEFPIILPKLCALVAIKFPISGQPSRVEVRLMLGESLVGEMIADDIPPVPLSPAGDNGSTDEMMAVLQMNFTVSPMQIDQPNTLRVLCHTDREVLKGNALKIRLMTEEERATLLPIA